MSARLALDERVVALSAALATAGIPHAFGGALALAYYAEPRATIDIDVNVFVPPSETRPLFDVLDGLGVTVEHRPLGRELRDQGQARVRWDDVPLDLFLSYDPFHEACARRARWVPFGDARIPVLAGQDLLVCKAVFDRRKDWIDIEQMLLTTAGELDVDDARVWLVRFVGEDDHRLVAFDAAVEEILGPS